MHYIGSLSIEADSKFAQTSWNSIISLPVGLLTNYTPKLNDLVACILSYVKHNVDSAKPIS